MKTNPTKVEYELLVIVSVRELPGREVARRYKEATGKAIAYGTLYSTFRRLRDAGWVTARDDEDIDGRIRFFHITAQGARAVQSAREEYGRLGAFGIPCGESR